MCFKEKIVIITGGSRGIGKACALSFAEAGAKVIFTYNTNKAAALSLENELNSMSGGCLAVCADVSDYSACRQLADSVISKYERIDILVNNAGIVRDRALMMMKLEDWQDVINVNLNGVFNMSRVCITTMLKQKTGCIINMSSVGGMIGMPRQTNYSAAKAGIIGFSKSLAKEVAPYNVRVNTICPGYVETDMLNDLKDDIKEKIVAEIPAKRMGLPQDIAELCLFLASDKAKYIIGETIKIDGGLTA
ncbi:MAG: 3-oxoacyl-[acyl-carrier-protein] reductase [Candidatus Omnitrophica bacterium]|nr:3-oxoacyl-[acyl-carrier-protein] reductase [Candidatus Omnitrophota bacterium]MDD5081329.1 3-oxoacyl-[acyl-carrier-protein] reductase [Candidatus Omnitrophota bacterium]MDD5440985.1 3-oxoacyl-[acyl-carrier-protein] reductase [Candidatus Omnitrophota bacterium]